MALAHATTQKNSDSYGSEFFALPQDLELQRVQLDAGAHRRRQHGGLDVGTLRRGGLRLDDGLHQRAQVLGQLRLFERSLADRAVDDGGLVHAVLDLTGLDRKSVV